MQKAARHLRDTQRHCCPDEADEGGAAWQGSVWSFPSLVLAEHRHVALAGLVLLRRNEHDIATAAQRALAQVQTAPTSAVKYDARAPWATRSICSNLFTSNYLRHWLR